MNLHQPSTINHQPSLEPGMVLNLPSSGLAEVISVNEFRARVRSLNKRHVEINTAFEGDKHFVASGREWDISPNSEVEIVRSTDYQSVEVK